MERDTTAAAGGAAEGEGIAVLQSIYLKSCACNLPSPAETSVEEDSIPAGSRTRTAKDPTLLFRVNTHIIITSIQL